MDLKYFIYGIHEKTVGCFLIKKKKISHGRRIILSSKGKKDAYEGR
jgi:hypothetical protein